MRNAAYQNEHRRRERVAREVRGAEMFASKRRPRDRQENANPRCFTAVRILDRQLPVWVFQRHASRPRCDSHTRSRERR